MPWSASHWNVVVQLIGIILLWGIGGAAEGARADTVPHRHFKAFDGLPSEKITALAQTPNGLLWIGTETGLAVYDGNEFRQISFPDSIGTPYVSALRAMPDGSVWVAPSRGEVARVRLEGVVQVRDVGPQLVWGIFARDETLHFVTSDATWRLPPGTAKVQEEPHEYPDTVSGRGVISANLSPNGHIWILDRELGPGRVTAGGRVSFAGVPPAEPGTDWSALRFTANGTALALRDGTLYRIDTETGGIDPVVDDLPEPTHLTVGENDAYVTRGRQLLQIDVPSGRLRTVFGPGKGLPQTTPTVTFEDQQGGLWIGTHDGLLHLMEPGARVTGSVGGAPVQNVLQFLGNEKAFWARTMGSGLLRLSRPQRQAAPGGHTQWAALSSLGEELHALAAETGGWYEWTSESGWTYVRSVAGSLEGFIGRDGRGYFRHEDGLYRYEPTPGKTPTELVSWPKGESYLHDFAPAPNGDLIHRSREYVLRRRPEGTVIDTIGRLPDNSHPGDNELAINPRSNMRDMAMDGAGRVWGAFAYDGGLLRIDPDRGTQEVYLEDRRIWGVDVTGDSLVMASTRQQGLYLINASSGTIRRQLTREDGLKSGAVLTAHLLSDSLYVGHHNGMTRFPTQGLLRTPSSPEVLLTGGQINFEDRSLAMDSVLASDERAVGVDYTGVSLTHPERVQYEVRLLPRDPEWQTTTRRFTRYTNLEPGTYRFEVRARLGTQPPGPSAVYTFTIPPHFYETNWFRLLAVLAILCLGVAVVRWRTYRLQQRQDELETAVEARTLELQQRTQQLAEEKKTTEEQAERLAELDKAKNRFFAHISHEFRTPLSLILGPLRDALQRAADGSVAFSTRQVRRMTRSAERLQRLIDQLLDLATLEAGRMELDRRPGDLAALIRRSAEAFRSKAEQQGVDLRVRTPESPIETRFDPEKVETIASNLVGNAVKFTPEGGRVTVRITQLPPGNEDEGAASVEAPDGGTPTEGTARIEVADTGPGIDPEVQSSLFDRFEQADNSETRQHEGTGLGLALSRELAELHGGTIEVESTPGEGATFTVQLPLVPVAETVGDAAQADAHEQPSVQLAAAGNGVAPGAEAEEDAPADEERATVLVVEDNDEMRAYLREELSTRWTVREASNGKDGWEDIQSAPPDLVVSDVMMPEMDGFELCEQIKSTEALRTVPVLLLTARAGEGAAVEGLEAGADDYVAKPFDAEELRQRIENHLAARRHLKNRYQAEVRLEGLAELGEVDEEGVPIMEKVIEAAQGRLDNPDFTVGDLASSLAMSRRQLTRRLKRAVGETPGDVIYQLRIARAKTLLTEAESVAEVAYAVGYRSPSSFSQSFRKATGMTPSEFVDADAEE